jgi:hypothetical protein
MPNIDVKLPDDIRAQLEMPRCLDIKIPKPELPQIRLPTGATIKGIADITKGVPSDCSLNFNLVLQLGPLLASIQCLVKLLALIAPLIDVIKALPDPMKIAQAMPKFVKAAEDLAPCLLIPTPLALLPFIGDILRLIIKMLHCLTQELRSIVNLIGGLELKIAAAQQDGNAELLATLNCARESADAAMQSTMMGIEPIKVILDLIQPLLGMAGVDPIEIPGIASPQDLQQLNDVLTTLDNVTATLQLVADALP